MRIGSNIRVDRVEGGVPTIFAPTAFEAVKGLGAMHVIDRGAQMEVSRLMALGRSSQFLAAHPTLVKMDTFVRRMGVYRDPRRDLMGLSERAKKMLRAYVDGVNKGWKSRRRPTVFRLWGYRPVPWTEADVVRLLRFTSFVGLASAQISTERALIEMVRRGVPQGHITELFGPGAQGLDAELIQSVNYRDRADGHRDSSTAEYSVLPGASNAWAVAPSRSGTRHAIIAGDPHMDVNRLPALWYEAELHTPDNVVAGATTPGLPVVLFGRNQRVAWSMTYAPGDSVDYFVEECRDGERKVGRRWVPFQKRTEEVPIKGGQSRRFDVPVSENGILLGDPTVAGRYLSLRWTGEPGAFGSSIEAMVELQRCRTAIEAAELVKGVRFPSVGWILADREGNIASQLSGQFPMRGDGVSGLYPVPGWIKKNAWRGVIDPDRLPGEINPERGFVAFANQPVALPNGPSLVSSTHSSYRYDRITGLLGDHDNWSVNDMQLMQYDLISPQAERLVPVFLDHMDDDDARRELSDWSFNFPPRSRRATLYDNIYRAALRVTFGDGGLSRDWLAFLLDNTSLYLSVVAGVDAVLLNPESPWFTGRDYGDCMRRAVSEGVRAKRETWGERSPVTHKNHLFGDTLKRLPRLNKGPFGMPGHHSTIHQGVRVRDQGVDGVYGPSYRFVTDLASHTMWTNLPGGPSENPLNRYYASNLAGWRFANYKRLRLKRSRNAR